MKTLKKLACFVLALAMVLGLTVTSFAAESSYTITINNNTTSGHTYEAYQIFDGTLTGSGTSADPYVLSDITWGSGVDTSSTVDEKTLIEALQAISITGSNNVAIAPFSGCSSAAEVAAVLGSTDYNSTDSTLAQKFADVVSSYLISANAVTSTENTDNGSTTGYTITVTDPGYYLVKDEDRSLDRDDDAYTRFILYVVGDVSATPKSSTPTVKKKVLEESYTSDDGYGTGYNDVADYDIGDAVSFKLIGTLPSTLADYDTYQYIFHDTLSSGLTFDSSSVVVTVDGTTVPETYGATTNYTVVDSGLTDGCSFEVQFTDVLSLVDAYGASVTVTKDSEIVVTYTATLNSDAVIGLGGNENEVYLEYSNNPNAGGDGDTGKTPEDKVIVFTYELDVTKTNGTDSSATTLSGAKFVLYKTENGVNYYVQVDSNGKVTGWTQTESEASTLVSGSDGLFKVIGLDDGTYYLKETEAPTGYNLLKDPIELVIAATTTNGQSWSGTASDALTALTISVDGGSAEKGDTSTGVVSTTVVNNVGSSLPSTGGIGTTIFYIIGGIIVVGAAVLLITRRRMRRV